MACVWARHIRQTNAVWYVQNDAFLHSYIRFHRNTHEPLLDGGNVFISIGDVCCCVTMTTISGLRHSDTGRSIDNSIHLTAIKIMAHTPTHTHTQRTRSPRWMAKSLMNDAAVSVFVFSFYTRGTGGQVIGENCKWLINMRVSVLAPTPTQHNFEIENWYETGIISLR